MCWPAPVLAPSGGNEEVGRVCLKVPVLSALPQEDGFDLFPPAAHLVATWPTGRVVSFVNHHFDSPWGHSIDYSVPIASFPHASLRTRGESYSELRTEAYRCYDTLLSEMANDRDPSEHLWRSLGAALKPVLEPGLLPFYRLLAPNFFGRISNFLSA